jgi:hypothetical protein
MPQAGAPLPGGRAELSSLAKDCGLSYVFDGEMAGTIKSVTQRASNLGT